MKKKIWCPLCNRYHQRITITDPDGKIRKVILSEVMNDEESNHSNLDLDGIDEPEPAA